MPGCALKGLSPKARTWPKLLKKTSLGCAASGFYQFGYESGSRIWGSFGTSVGFKPNVWAASKRRRPSDRSSDLCQPSLLHCALHAPSLGVMGEQGIDCKSSRLRLTEWPWTMKRLKEFSLAKRLLVTFVASVMLAMALPGSFSHGTRALVVWNVAILVFLGQIVAMIIGKTPEQVRDRVRRDGHGRARVLSGVILAALSSLTGVGLILGEMERHQSGFRTQINLCVATVFSSWVLLQTMWALFYAREYWQADNRKGGEAVAGLEFPDEGAPDYWDFIYFSFTLGMCYGTSDVQIKSRTVRRMALMQVVISYSFSTILIALVINAIGTLL